MRLTVFFFLLSACVQSIRVVERIALNLHATLRSIFCRHRALRKLTTTITGFTTRRCRVRDQKNQRECIFPFAESRAVPPSAGRSAAPRADNKYFIAEITVRNTSAKYARTLARAGAMTGHICSLLEERNEWQFSRFSRRPRAHTTSFPSIERSAVEDLR